MKKLLSVILAALLCLSLAACGADPVPATPAPQPAQQDTPVAPEPEQEPEPEVYTPHEPLVFEGSGDDVVEMPLLDYYYAFHITGNAESRHFAVKAYDGDGNYNELLVSTTDAYDGVTYDMELNTELLEVSASGPWQIEVIDLHTLDKAAAGQTYAGSGDYILLLSAAGKTATIKGNDGAHHFAVKSFDDCGTYLDLLVNTTDPYEGTVMLKNNPSYLLITAEGDWTIQF